MLLISMSLFAKDNFTVVYLDRTEVNMEATVYIKKQLSVQKVPLNVKFLKGLSKVDSTSGPIVLLNTGVSTGIDPRLEAFIKTQTDTSRFVLANAYKMGAKIFFSTTPMSNSSVGVDEISASSYYDGKNTEAMHQQWTAELFSLVQARL